MSTCLPASEIRRRNPKYAKEIDGLVARKGVQIVRTVNGVPEYSEELMVVAAHVTAVEENIRTCGGRNGKGAGVPRDRTTLARETAAAEKRLGLT